MKTLGNPTKENISSSCEWLVPIISSRPSTISRLSSSAALYLLLATMDDEKLVELAAPLISHTGKCLRGDFGAEDSFNAAKILFDDLMSEESKARDSARRVLQEALGGHEHVAAEVNAGWLMNVRSLWGGEEKFLNLTKRAIEVGLKKEEGLLLRHYACSISSIFIGKDLEAAEKSVCQMLRERVRESSKLLRAFPDFQLACCNALLATEELGGEKNKLQENEEEHKTLVAAVVVASKSRKGGSGGDLENNSRDQYLLLVERLFERLTSVGEGFLGLQHWLMMATSDNILVSGKACKECKLKDVPLFLIASGLSKDNILILLDRVKKGDTFKGVDYKSYWGFGVQEGKSVIRGSVEAYSNMYGINLGSYKWINGLGEARRVGWKADDGMEGKGGEVGEEEMALLEVLAKIDNEAEEEGSGEGRVKVDQAVAIEEEGEMEQKVWRLADLSESFVEGCAKGGKWPLLVKAAGDVYREVIHLRLGRIVGTTCEEDRANNSACANLALTMLRRAKGDEGGLSRAVFSLLSLVEEGSEKKGECLRLIFGSER
jgi:hypothetical protein